MSVELSDISLRIYKLYRPYFGLKVEQLLRTIALGMVVVGNISLAVVFGFINTTMSALFGVLQQPGVSYSAFFASFSTALWYFGIYFVISFVKDKFLDFLQSSLSHAIDMDLVERWAKNKAFYGIKFLPNKNKLPSKNAKAFKDDTDEDEEEELNPAQIMSYDNADLIVNMTYVTDHLLSASCTFIVAMISLYAISAPLTFTLYSMSVTIPGYIAIASLGYSIVVNMLISYVGKPLKDAEAKIKKAQSILYRKTTEIMQHAESIAFLKGSEFEYQQLKSVIQDARIFKDASAKIRLMINSIVNMNYTINQFVPMLFSLPNIVAQKMSVDSLFEVIPNFQAVVDLLTWKNQNYEVLALSEVSLTRIEKFSELLKQWEDEQSATHKNQLKFETNSQQNTFVIKNLTVLKPDKKPAFKNVNFSLEKGTSSLIEGKSGAGKTTLIRAVAQLWPYLKAGGEIKLPHALAKIIFIPQSGFVYHQGDSLLDTILYPDKVPASSALVHELKSMLKKMGFKNEIVRDLEKVKDWKSELSGGEKQRIAIISAIVKNPDVLFMDESTSALDHSTKEKVITVIKNKLPNCAIGIVDHNPNDTFIDKRVSLDAKRKRS